MALPPEFQGQTLPGGKLSYCRKCAQRAEDQFHLLASDVGPQDPVPEALLLLQPVHS